MCYLSKKPSKYFSFCDTIFSSRERSGRICYLPYCYISKKGKKKRKKSLLHGMWKLVGARWNRLAMVCERKSRKDKIVRTPLPVVDKNNHLSKQFFISILQMKSLSTCLIPASLYEGPFFYFYVESSPSTFMDRLREHSCHSDYNVHSPKIYYWLIHDYGFACS
jgi:hypothetical protein